MAHRLVVGLSMRLRAVLLCATMLALPAQMSCAAPRAHKAEKAPAAESDPPPAAPAPPPDTKPYDPQLMRLAEILGALTTMRQVCGAPDADKWRQRMQALLDSEGTPDSRKEKLAGAYNRGLHGYELSYRSCTPNARLVVRRFLDESARLARDIEARYRAS